jgi:DNA polymerase-3 subunit epsilon
LCPKYCHLQTNIESCFHYQIKQCKGICREEETVEDYNNRVLEAIASVKFDSENFVIKETGRTSEELTFILITDGVYRGFGYLPVDATHTPKEYKDALFMQKDNNDIKRILNSYLKNNSEMLLSLGSEFENINFEENVLSNAFN